MADNTAAAGLQDTVLLFGPQALSFDQESIACIRAAVLNSDTLQWISDAFAGLPDCLQQFTDTCPGLPVEQNRAVLRQHVQAFASGSISTTSNLPNIFLSPLVVAYQLIQYLAHLESRRKLGGDGHSRIDNSLLPHAETVGLCTGLLSAFAVSCSATKIELEIEGTVAIRLAMLIGLAVDLQEQSKEVNQSRSLAAVWTSGQTGDQVEELVQKTPDTYISVRYDTSRATITTAASVLPLLESRLSNIGVTSTRVSLRGRFHWQGNQRILEHLLAFCDKNVEFQFSQASWLPTPTRANDGQFLQRGHQLHTHALRAILLETSLWHQTFMAIHEGALAKETTRVLSFGPERCVPPSVLRKISQRVIHATQLEHTTDTAADRAELTIGGGNVGIKDDDIAVVGMSCKVAGANNLEEFWDLLCEGKSQHREVPQDRFDFETPFRKADTKRRWFGNFIDDYDTFDNKFFKKTPREVASTDPQQRQILQIAYQAVEQSGYFHSRSPNRRIGCYVGVCAVDYENNIACHEPNAFSATGNLKGFIAGKVSHHFGWTGPGLTIDTACSSSAVAVHQACQAILNGDCVAALAGGTHVMTNPLWFQNLAGASFLSQTGQCKPFDSQADGYCRGEGVAAVFLKKVSTAIADGDLILGTIRSTAVQQNANCTPIVVPNVPSLSDLFRVVTDKAKLKPDQISVVEAHGTGTPVGDPAEYDSIRQVLGASNRKQPLALSSVKGLVGHVECTSGLISLIKVLLMILKRAIPPQASFQKVNPSIGASEADHMIIPRSLQPWDLSLRAALVNNYGASGSNASLIVAQAPAKNSNGALASSIASNCEVFRQPFWLAGFDENSLLAQASGILQYMQKHKEPTTEMSLRNIAYNLYRQSNRSLDHALVFKSQTLGELENSLMDCTTGQSAMKSAKRGPERPLILCFGGQTSNILGLDRRVYDTIKIFKHHMDTCDAVCASIGVGHIVPDIFERDPVQDPVKLQAMLLAAQYSCAQTWINCGARPAALIGHSFGELTALCIAKVLSLEDTFRLVIGRASVVRDSWDSDRGVMAAVEGDLAQIEEIMEAINASQRSPGQVSISIACFNGPRNFTIAGPQVSIDRFYEVAAASTSNFSVKVKKLSVTHAFHSEFVEPLMGRLKDTASDLTFKTPTIPIERATVLEGDVNFGPSFVAEHMRHPVYFSQAAQRLAEKYGSGIWLEAGSGSGVTKLAQKAISSPSDVSFHSINLAGGNGLNDLTDATTSLWQAGLDVTYWAHHQQQSSDYTPLLLPPYQFEKTRHWLELRKAPTAAPVLPLQDSAATSEEPEGMLKFVGFEGEKGRLARFLVNTSSVDYDKLISGHIIAQTAPICPATVQIGFAIEALKKLIPEITPESFAPRIHNVQNHAAVCMAPERALWIELLAAEARPLSWHFAVTSTHAKGKTPPITHTSGLIDVHHPTDAQLKLEFDRYERLKGHQHSVSLLNSPDVDDIIQGRNVYKTFSEVVDYGPAYHGLQKLVGRGQESAGRVVKGYDNTTWLDAHLSDCFCQVGGIFVNCMTERDSNEMYIACGIEQWLRSPSLKQTDPRPEIWNVSAYHHGPKNKSYLTDIFVFDATTGALAEVVLGIRYLRVTKASIGNYLSRSTTALNYLQKGVKAQTSVDTISIQAAATVSLELPKPEAFVPQPDAVKAPTKDASCESEALQKGLSMQVKVLLAELTGLDAADIDDASNLADLGIDSLMGMEMAREIETTLKCSLSNDELNRTVDFSGLMKCVYKALEVDLTSTKNTFEDEGISVGSSSILGDQSPPLVTTNAINEAAATEFLADFLGMDTGELRPDAVLQDLGVDSLLSMELKHELHNKFGVSLADDLSLEDLTVSHLCEMLGGTANGTSDPAPAGQSMDRVLEILPPAPPCTPADTYASQELRAVDLSLNPDIVLEAFDETNHGNDRLISEYGCDNYMESVLPLKTDLCVALVVEMLEELGCSIRTAQPGQELVRISCSAEHRNLVDYLYNMVCKESGLIEIEADRILRTEAPFHVKNSSEILLDLRSRFPDHVGACDLTYYAGSSLSKVLRGETDGIKLIFGSEEGRRLVSALYGDWPINRLYYKQMETFLACLAPKLPKQTGPLKILEMGAGTGGTTKWLLPLVKELGINVEYTFTDLAPSFVAGARKRFKEYPFVKYRTHDIEKAPADDLVGTQHIVIASNAVHATHSLTKSTANIRQLLRPDGLLLMLEMTDTLYWVDMIFGLFEGWWLFDDGRRHAVASETFWRESLQAVGYGTVRWTDGRLPENKIEKLILGLASGPKDEVTNVRKERPLPWGSSTDCAGRLAIVEGYVQKYTSGFSVEARPTSGVPAKAPTEGSCVLITGASGSLGCHLVADLAKLDHVHTIICLNRRSNTDPRMRQLQSIISKGIYVSPAGLAKVKAYETDMGQPRLGLPEGIYSDLSSSVTHIMHNAWLMSAKHSIKTFESQFRIMRNMIDFANAVGASAERPPQFKPSFIFTSSIAVVGYYPLWKHDANVPEQRVPIDAVLPNGYGDAKYTCELMLDATLHRHPDRFRATAVRIGQIAGSKQSGYWNPMEHLSYLWKSSQTLKALPDFQGLLSWTPVDDVAGAVVDLLLEPVPYPIYHIDNPVRQHWRDMIPVLAKALDIPLANAVPFTEWCARVRQSPHIREADNPALKLVDFLDENFLRMSCGGLLLDTTRAREHSKTMRAVRPVSDDVARKFVQSWKNMKFLS